MSNLSEQSSLNPFVYYLAMYLFPVRDILTWNNPLDIHESFFIVSSTIPIHKDIHRSIPSSK